MERSAATIKAIKALGYPGASCVTRCGCDELPCPLLSWLCAELSSLCPELQDALRAGEVLLVGELRAVLSELCCPLAGSASEGLGSEVLHRVAEFLISELQAAQIITHKKAHPEEEKSDEQETKEQRVEDLSHEPAEVCPEYGETEETRRAETQAEWILLLHALDMDTSAEFTAVKSEVESRLARLECRDMMEPLLSTSLSSEQWVQVEDLNRRLSKDYQCRRHMMIKRFQVTLESFAWGEKTNERSKALASVPPLASLADTSRTSLSLLLAARVNRSIIEPIKAGRSTHVYKMRMGSVPDRGGRPGEIEPPMPVWEKQRSRGNRSGRGGGHHQRHKFSDKKKKGDKD